MLPPLFTAVGVAPQPVRRCEPKGPSDQNSRGLTGGPPMQLPTRRIRQQGAMIVPDSLNIAMLTIIETLPDIGGKRSKRTL
jgi:hypothetical protein